MIFQIKSCFTLAVQFECELPSDMDTKPYSVQLGCAVKAAIIARADLAGADLAGANLAGADLARADLARAYLADANLAGADLARANLADANLAGADLARAYLAGAYLAGAYLAGAYLAGADLARAYLAGADLAGANLAGAYLAGADLARAYLAGANLADAYLAGADLARAYLADANLAGADLTGANLADADLADAYLADADLADAKNVPACTAAVNPSEPYERKPTAERRAEHVQRYRERNPDVPVVQGLDAKILGVIDSGKGKLNMSTWHTCKTTHCRAGWAITLAGEAGLALEAKYGPQRAGTMIYRASTGFVPHFFASDERALEDIRACATEGLCGV
jgi:uncharacterized protein YjbI with pentapeptide repeats